MVRVILDHSKSSRTSTTWPVGWCWERRRWRALDGRYGDVKRERLCGREFSCFFSLSFDVTPAANGLNETRARQRGWRNSPSTTSASRRGSEGLPRRSREPHTSCCHSSRRPPLSGAVRMLACGITNVASRPARPPCARRSMPCRPSACQRHIAARQHQQRSLRERGCLWSCPAGAAGVAGVAGVAGAAWAAWPPARRRRRRRRQQRSIRERGRL